MKAPLKWLKEFVEIDCSVEELADKLLAAGFEVEEIIYTGKDIERVVVGKILQITPHFNADKLSVCSVDCGREILTIVTGAKNVKVGDLVPVALDGAVLPEGKRITAGDLRGVTSQGMLCGGSELGIDDVVCAGASVDGILILPSGNTGDDIKEVLGLDEYVLDVSITSNRPDCQCILGLAREIAAVTGKKINQPSLSFKGKDDDIEGFIRVSVEDRDICPRYIAHAVTETKVRQSPDWMRRRLQLVGIRPINNFVDITNYVLTEIGQPLHAFDLRFLEGRRIVVRAARPNESIVALDGKQYALSAGMGVIADAVKPVAIAGVMGGEYSGIHSDTADIILESARFARGSVRSTSRTLGLRSDSSARYEKGVDDYTLETGVARALHLITKLKAGKIISVAAGDASIEAKPRPMTVAVADINKLLGISIPHTAMTKILKSLEFGCEYRNGMLELAVPAFRQDIDNHTDIAEEIIRVYGYDKITPTLMRGAQITSGGMSARERWSEAVRNRLAALGALEAVNYSFISSEYCKELGLDNANPIALKNPLSEEMSVMRTTLSYGMLKSCAFNLNRKNNEFALFEIGRTYHAKTQPLTELPIETTRVCVAVSGEQTSFFSLKSIAEDIAALFGAPTEYRRGACPYLHTGINADIFCDKSNIGSIGEVHPEVAQRFGLTQKVYILEMDIDYLMNTERATLRFVPLPKYPAAPRDIAIVVDDKHGAGDIMRDIAAFPLVAEVELFDVYQGGQISKGCKSLAYSLKLVAPDRTLTEAEINSCIGEIVGMLESKYSAKLR